MTIQNDIYTRLSGYAGLVTLVGTKIYPQTVPDEVELPYVTISIVSDVPEHAMGADCDIRTIRAQVSCWADDYDVSKAIEVQVKAALSRYRSGNIKECLIDSSLDLYDGETFHVPIDFTVFYEE